MLNPGSVVRVGLVEKTGKGSEEWIDTVRAHSSGPDVDRGRWPNLGLFLSLGWEDMVREDWRGRGFVKQFRWADVRDLVVWHLWMLLFAVLGCHGGVGKDLGRCIVDAEASREFKEESYAARKLRRELGQQQARFR